MVVGRCSTGFQTSNLLEPLRTEVNKRWPISHIQPDTCFCESSFARVSVYFARQSTGEAATGPHHRALPREHLLTSAELYFNYTLILRKEIFNIIQATSF